MTGTQDPSFERNAITTYRYLRLAIVVVVVALWVGVFVEYAKDDCLQRSLSAYYHTPVHALFIGAMMTIGVCMIVIKGRTGLEDTLLNLAGVLALVVAFVPTTVDVRRGTQQPLCTSSPLVMPRPDRFIANNLLALAVGGVIAIAVAYGIASVRKITVMTAPGRVGRIGFGLLAALLIVGVVLYHTNHGWFMDNAHGVSAVVMFIVFGMIVVYSARTSTSPLARTLYTVIAGLMAFGAVVGVLARSADHAVLLLEIIEIGLFALFWIVATIENWGTGARAITD